MCIPYNDKLIVNGILSAYIPQQFDGNISKAYDHYEAVAKEHLSGKLKQDAAEKWRWMEQHILGERTASQA
jgi:hypothetical protein